MKKSIKPNDLQYTAYYNAGQAVARYLINASAKSMTIKIGLQPWPQLTVRQRVKLFNKPLAAPTLRFVIEDSIILLAGEYAVEMFNGRRRRVSTVADTHSYYELAVHLVIDEKEFKFFDRWIRYRTTTLLQQNWYRVEALANKLYEQTTLTAKETRSTLFWLGTIANRDKKNKRKSTISKRLGNPTPPR